jgi:hypothetical protein
MLYFKQVIKEEQRSNSILFRYAPEFLAVNIDTTACSTSSCVSTAARLFFS